MIRAALSAVGFAIMSWGAWRDGHPWTSGVAFGAGLIIGVVELRAALDARKAAQRHGPTCLCGVCVDKG